MNMDYKKSWFNYLVLMFQKEVADRMYQASIIRLMVDYQL